LPKHITVDQVYEAFKKCGRIAKDLDGQPKIKLYRTDSGELKGDCRVQFEFEESVGIAVDLMN
jgi:hypothetical protein